MKKTTLILLFLISSMLLFDNDAGAQAANSGRRPIMYSKQIQGKMALMRPHNTPLSGPSFQNLVLPKSVMDLIQSPSSLQRTPPLSEKQKTEILLNRMQQYADARNKSAG